MISWLWPVKITLIDLKLRENILIDQFYTLHKDFNGLHIIEDLYNFSVSKDNQLIVKEEHELKVWLKASKQALHLAHHLVTICIVHIRIQSLFLWLMEWTINNSITHPWESQEILHPKVERYQTIMVKYHFWEDQTKKVEEKLQVCYVDQMMEHFELKFYI